MSATKTASPDAPRDPLPSGLTCVGCGYLLRGQTAEGRCPECGRAIRETPAAQSLTSWPAEWVRRLRWGLRLLAAATALGWVMMCWFTVTDMGGFTLILPIASEFRGLRAFRNERLLVASILAAFGLGLWGAVTLTFSEAARIVGSERPRAPWLAKAGIAGGAVAFVAMLVPFLMSGRAGTAVVIVWFAVFIGGAVAAWNLGTFLTRLVRRIPDHHLARRCESFRWLALLVILLASADAASFWPVVSWLPITTSRVGWPTIAAIETVILVGRVSLLLGGAVAVSLLRAYAKRLGPLSALPTRSVPS